MEIFVICFAQPPQKKQLFKNSFQRRSLNYLPTKKTPSHTLHIGQSAVASAEEEGSTVTLYASAMR